MTKIARMLGIVIWIVGALQGNDLFCAIGWLLFGGGSYIEFRNDEQPWDMIVVMFTIFFFTWYMYDFYKGIEGL